MSERRILMIIAPEQFRDEELQVPRQAFQDAGWTVDVASTRVGEATGMLGATESVILDLALAENGVRDRMYDAVVVVGGMGSPEFLWENASLHTLLQQAKSQGSVIAAICLSGAVLAKAGLLEGKRATVWEMDASVEALKAGGAQYTAEAVTTDGDIVTANGPEAAAEFAQAVLVQVKALVPA